MEMLPHHSGDIAAGTLRLLREAKKLLPAAIKQARGDGMRRGSPALLPHRAPRHARCPRGYHVSRTTYMELQHGRA